MFRFLMSLVVNLVDDVDTAASHLHFALLLSTEETWKTSRHFCDQFQNGLSCKM